MSSTLFKWRNVSRLALIVIIAGLGLVACVTQPPAQPSTGEEAPEAPEAAALAAEPVELNLKMVDYSENTKKLFEEELIPEFENNVWPGAEVTVEWGLWNRHNEEMTTAFAGGVTPDVYQGGAVWSPQMAQRGWAISLDDYIASADPDWDWDDFFPALQDDVTIDGNIIAVPYRMDLRSFWFRKDHLEEAGLEAPTNWEELEAAAVALTQRDGDTITREGFHFSGPGYPGGWQVDLQAYMIFMHQAGGQILSDDLTKCTLNEPPAVEALEFIQKLILEHKVQPYPGFEVQGNLGPMEAGLASTTVHRADPDFNATQYAPDQAEFLQITEPLTGPAKKATQVWINKYFISSASKSPDAAWALLQFLTNRENLAKYSASFDSIPPRASLGDADFMTDSMKVLLTSANYAVPYPKHPRLIELFRPFATNLESALRGEMTAQETMDKTCDEINAILVEDQ